MLRVKTVLAGVLCVVLMGGFAAVASAQEPPIGALVGNWLVSSSRIAADLETGGVAKQKVSEVWNITIESGDVLRIVGFSGSPDSPIFATYAEGVLFLGIFDEGVPYAHTGYAVLKGSPGKLQFQGEVIAFGAGDWDSLCADTIKGKQLPPPTAPPAPAVAGGTGMRANIQAAKKPVTPPDIEDLYDTYWIVKVGGKGYEFDEDFPYSFKETLFWHITQGADTDSLIVESDDGEETETLDVMYMNGFIIMADGNDTNPATGGMCAYMQVTGTLGKLKLAGKFLGFVIGGSDDFVESSSLKGKQVQPPL